MKSSQLIFTDEKQRAMHLVNSQWHEFVTLKNNDGWTVKMNLNNFDVSVSQVADNGRVLGEEADKQP